MKLLVKIFFDNFLEVYFGWLFAKYFLELQKYQQNNSFTPESNIKVMRIKEGRDCELKKLLTLSQIFLLSNIGNV